MLLLDMLRVLLILLSLFFVGCVSKKPITWKQRVFETKVTPLKLTYDEYSKEHNQTLLFLHGFGESRYTWRFIVGKLSQKYHIITLDLKGFGESPKPKDSAYSVYDQAGLVNDFIKRKGLTDITLIGRSFGGGVSLVLALMQEQKIIKKKIDRLVLIDTMSYKQNLPSMMRYLSYPIIGYLSIHLLPNRYIATEAYRYAFFNDKLIPKSSIDYSAKILSLSNSKYAYLQTVKDIIPDDIEKMEREYKSIKIPTLILWGRDDVSINYRLGMRLNRDIPNSILKVFRKVGHMPQEEAPKKVIYEIESFINSTNNLN
jgi:pimeloyl-ACP methyl ester carboxylesterase